MPHVVRHYASLEIAEVTYSGSVTSADLHRATNDKMALQRKHGVLRFLVSLDCEMNVTPAELETLLDEQYWQADVNRNSRIAIVQPARQKASEMAAYFIVACRKRGWKAEILPDRTAAMDWLTSR